MYRPFCGAEDTSVIDSRLSAEGREVRRRRRCGQCQMRFNTYETAELTLPRVIKREGQRVTFDPQKIRIGVLRALEKRPVTTDKIEAAVSRVVKKAQTQGESEIASRTIGEWVMDELKELDPVAYVRFASVYRSFEDVDAFKKEIERLKIKD